MAVTGEITVQERRRLEDRQDARHGLRTSDVETPISASVLGLQRSIGNRAVQLLLRQALPPTSDKIKELWERAWTTKDVERECTDVARGMARDLGGSTLDAGKPVMRFSKWDKKATAEEVADAHSRGRRYRDRLKPNTDTLIVHSGAAGGGRTPRKTEVQLQPGMLIYTAEDAGWWNESARTYRWYQRHMMMYAGNGIVYENWVDPKNPRNLWTSTQGVHPNTYKMLVVLSIYDPFKEHRAALVDRFVKGAQQIRSSVESTLENLTPWR